LIDYQVDMLRAMGTERNEKLLAVRGELERLKSEVADMVKPIREFVRPN